MPDAYNDVTKKSKESTHHKNLNQKPTHTMSSVMHTQSTHIHLDIDNESISNNDIPPSVDEEETQLVISRSMLNEMESKLIN